jgi:hypothetical protein
MKRLLCAVALCATLACTKSEPVAKPTQAGALAPVALPNGHPVVTPLPDPEMNGGNVGRAPRRITAAQLKNSIFTVTGRHWSQIDSLSASLGQADFALVNSESTEPNLVFAKFLEDGAREVCMATAASDLTKAPQARVLSADLPGSPTDFTTIDDAAVRKNLSGLAVRFWGQPMGADELTTYASTFKTIAARAKAVNQPAQAWGAICIALMTDPRFITY